MSAKDELLSALKHYEIEVESATDKYVYTQGLFCIEIEDENLYRLSQDGYVVAPYDDLNQLCQMIKAG